MRLTTIVPALAGCSLAAPGLSPSSLATRDDTDQGQSHPLEPDTSGGSVHAERFVYSRNWAGGVVPAPGGESFVTASASFNVPDVSQPDSETGPHAAAAWVGIDGSLNTAAILQAGCNFHSYSNYDPAYTCWVEYFPSPMVNVAGFTPSAGDQISVAVQVTSPTSGTATLTNQNTGQSVTQTLNAPRADATLAGLTAEFIVEDYAGPNGQVPFTNFCAVTFSGCTAGGASGASYGLDRANNWEIKNQSTGYLTAISKIVPSAGTVEVDRWDNSGSGSIGC